MRTERENEIATGILSNIKGRVFRHNPSPESDYGVYCYRSDLRLDTIVNEVHVEIFAGTGKDTVAYARGAIQKRNGPDFNQHLGKNQRVVYLVANDEVLDARESGTGRPSVMELLRVGEETQARLNKHTFMVCPSHPTKKEFRAIADSLKEIALSE